ncbi:ribbon-helix-helix domain-containing protein [Planktothrix sp.]|uniref:ribbon-helix-helix domain-containing protein n=1 Tax=Planktothrix sp. TaxID=3088171 RepID=UPI0038D4BBE8
MINVVSKRITAYVPDSVYKKIEERCQQEGRTMSSLISFIVESAMKEWEKENKGDK